MFGELLSESYNICYNSVMKSKYARKLLPLAVTILIAVTLVAVSACNEKDPIAFEQREVTVYLSDGEDMVLTYTPVVKTASDKDGYTLSAANPALAKVSEDGKSLILSSEGSVMITATAEDGTKATMMLYIVEYRPGSADTPDHSGYWEVSFDTGEFGSLAVQYVRDGEYLKAVTPGGGPPGESFYGWYTDPQFKNYFDIASTPVHASMTLYGFWAPGEPTYEYREENGKTYIAKLSHPNLEYDEITLPASIPGGTEIYGIRQSAFAENEHVRKITVPEGIRFIGKDAFSQCQSLTEVVLPSTLELIEEGAFSDCPKLTTVTFAPSDTLKEIGAECFKNCPELTSVNLPDSVSSLGQSAFEGDSALTSFDIPDSLQVLQKKLFYDSGLESIDLENRITDIYNMVFWGSNSLKTVTGYDNIKVMGSYVFGSGNDVSSITGWLAEAYNTGDGAAYLGHVLVYAFPATRRDFTVKPTTRLIAGQAFSDVESGIITFTIIKEEYIPDYGSYAFGETVLNGESVPYPSVDLVVPKDYVDLYKKKWLQPTSDSNGDTVPTQYSFNVVQNIYVESALGFYAAEGGGTVATLTADVYMRTPYLAVNGVYFNKSSVTDGDLSTGLTADTSKVCYVFSKYLDDVSGSLNLAEYINNSTHSVGKTAYIDDILPFAFANDSAGSNPGIDNMTGIQLPNRISRIHYMAFTYLKNLKTVDFCGEAGLGLNFEPAEINELSFNFSTLHADAAIYIEPDYYLSGGNTGKTLYSAYRSAWEDILPSGKLKRF